LPIPLSEILSYFEMYYIKGVDERERILSRVRALDRAYVNHATEKIRDELDDKKSKRAIDR